MPSDAPPDWPNDEKQFLEVKAALEKAALAGTWQAAAGDLKRSADVGSWVEHYPLASVVGGAALGLVAAFQLIPSGRAPRRSEPAPEHSQPPVEAHESTEKNSGSLWGLVISTGLGILKDAIVPSLRANFEEKLRAKPVAEHDEL